MLVGKNTVCMACESDSMGNSAQHIVTGGLHSMPMNHFPIHSGIQPAELCCYGATLFLAKHGTLDLDHILHGQLAGLLDVLRERLKSRRPFVLAVWKLLNDLSKLGICAAQ